MAAIIPETAAGKETDGMGQDRKPSPTGGKERQEVGQQTLAGDGQEDDAGDGDPPAGRHEVERARRLR